MFLSAAEAKAITQAAEDAANGTQEVPQVLKQDWLDKPHWERLYKHYGLRKPPYNLPCSPKYMRRWMGRSGISMEEYVDLTGFKSLKKYQEMNPMVPLWAFIGMLLEAREPMFHLNPG